MRWLLSPFSGLGAAGAAANARAELELAHSRALQASIVARRVMSSHPGEPLSPVVEARVA